METDCDDGEFNDSANFRSRSNTLPAKLARASSAQQKKNVASPAVRPSNVHNTLLAQTLLNNVRAELRVHSPDQLVSDAPDGNNFQRRPQQAAATAPVIHQPQQLLFQRGTLDGRFELNNFKPAVKCGSNAHSMHASNLNGNGMVHSSTVGSLNNLYASAILNRATHLLNSSENATVQANSNQCSNATPIYALQYPSGSPANSNGYVSPLGSDSAMSSVSRLCDDSMPTCDENSASMKIVDSTSQCDSLMAAENGSNGGGPIKIKPSRRNAWGNASYADLITQAIENSPDKRLTLSQIYDWMVQNVAYFKDKGEQNSSAGWKNSIRHNLSLHARFVRVQNEQTGKISYWTINYEAIRRERESVASGASTPRGSTGRRRSATLDAAECDKTRGKLRRRNDAVAAKLNEHQLALDTSRGHGVLGYDSCDSQSFDSPQPIGSLNRFDSFAYDPLLSNANSQSTLLGGASCQTLLVSVGGDNQGRLMTGVNVSSYRRDSSSPASSTGVFVNSTNSHSNSNVASPHGNFIRSGAVIDEERFESDVEEAVWPNVRYDRGPPRMHSASSMSLSTATASPVQNSPLSTVPAFASARSTPLQSISNAASGSAHSINGSGIQSFTPGHSFNYQPFGGGLSVGRPGSQGSLASHGLVQSQQFAQNNLAQAQYGLAASTGARLQNSAAQSQNVSPQTGRSHCESPVQAICSATRSFLTLDAGGVNNLNRPIDSNGNVDSLVLVGDGGACLYALPVTSGSANFGVPEFHAVHLNGSTNNNSNGYQVLFDGSGPPQQAAMAQGRLSDSQPPPQPQPQPSPALRAALLGCSSSVTPLQFTFASGNETVCSTNGNGTGSSQPQPSSACATSFVYASTNGMPVISNNELTLAGLTVFDNNNDNDSLMRSSTLRAPIPLGPRSSVDAIEPSLPFALNSSSIPLPSGTATDVHFFG